MLSHSITFVNVPQVRRNDNIYPSNHQILDHSAVRVGKLMQRIFQPRCTICERNIRTAGGFQERCWRQSYPSSTGDVWWFSQTTNVSSRLLKAQSHCVARKTPQIFNRKRAQVSAVAILLLENQQATIRFNGSISRSCKIEIWLIQRFVLAILLFVLKIDILSKIPWILKKTQNKTNTRKDNQYISQ